MSEVILRVTLEKLKKGEEFKMGELLYDNTIPFKTDNMKFFRVNSIYAAREYSKRSASFPRVVDIEEIEAPMGLVKKIKEFLFGGKPKVNRRCIAEKQGNVEGCAIYKGYCDLCDN